MIFRERGHISQGEGMNPKEMHTSQEAFTVGSYYTDLLGHTSLFERKSRCCFATHNRGGGRTGCKDLLGTNLEVLVQSFIPG